MFHYSRVQHNTLLSFQYHELKSIFSIILFNILGWVVSAYQFLFRWWWEYLYFILFIKSEIQTLAIVEGHKKSDVLYVLFCYYDHVH